MPWCSMASLASRASGNYNCTGNCNVFATLQRRIGESPVGPVKASLNTTQLHEHHSSSSSNSAVSELNFLRTKSLSSGSRSNGSDGVLYSSAGSRIAASIQTKIKEYPIVIYTKTRCPYGITVKALFRRLGVEPLVVELDELGPIQQQIRNALKRLTGQSTVPYVFIGGKFIGGCSDTMLLHQKGELTGLLAMAGLGLPWYQEQSGRESLTPCLQLMG